MDGLETVVFTPEVRSRGEISLHHVDEATDDARIAVLNELEGDALLELPIGTLGEEHASHAAAADLAHDAERADAVGGGASCSGGGLEERRCYLGGGRLERTVRPIGAK